MITVFHKITAMVVILNNNGFSYFIPQLPVV